MRHLSLFDTSSLLLLIIFVSFYAPQKNSTIICAVNMRRNMLSG